MAHLGLKNVKLTNFGNSSPSGAPNSLVSSLQGEDSDPSQCVICFSPWESEGTHRAASLRCGHIFGYSCAETWLKRNPSCPLCKKKNRVSDLRHHFLEFPKTTESDPSLLMELRQAREELLRAKSEIAQLKSSGIPHLPGNSAHPQYENRSHANSARTVPINGRNFEILKQIGGLTHPCCVDYSCILNACIVAGASPSGGCEPVKIYPTYHRGLKPIIDHPSSYGISILSYWGGLDPLISYVPLFDNPITDMVISPFESDIFLVTSVDGSLKVVRVSSHATGAYDAVGPTEYLAANVLVELFIENGEHGISAACWDVTSPSIIYVASGSLVRAFDLSTGDVTYELDVGPYTPRVTTNPNLKEEAIFALLSLPVNLDSESPRLLIGATWGLYHVLMAKDLVSPTWEMSEALIHLSSKGDWFDDTSSEVGLPHKHPDLGDNNKPYWNLLKPMASDSHPTGDSEEPSNSANTNSSTDSFLFVCGYQTPTHQKYITFDLKLNGRADVPAPMCPLVFNIGHHKKTPFTHTPLPRPEISRGSAHFMEIDSRFYLLALAPDNQEVVFIQPKPLIQLARNLDFYHPLMNLMPRTTLQQLSSCHSWKSVPTTLVGPALDGKTLFFGLSSSTLFLIGSW